MIALCSYDCIASGAERYVLYFDSQCFSIKFISSNVPGTRGKKRCFSNH